MQTKEATCGSIFSLIKILNKKKIVLIHYIPAHFGGNSKFFEENEVQIFVCRVSNLSLIRFTTDLPFSLSFNYQGI